MIIFDHGRQHAAPENVRIGDLIEVHLFVNEGPMCREEWRAAKCIVLPDLGSTIGVEFKDGTRMMVRSGEWR